MTPYFCATCEIALATPELIAPTRNATFSCLMRRSATRDPVAGVVSVSRWTHFMGRPRTPPLALNSAMAIRTPRLSESPLAAYCPLASAVIPMTIGFAAFEPPEPDFVQDIVQDMADTIRLDERAILENNLPRAATIRHLISSTPRRSPCIGRPPCRPPDRSRIPC